MIYFCADDYGISKISNTRIEECLKNGVLNKISVLPNGDISNFNEQLLDEDVKLSLHLNLVEGYPLSKKEDVSLIVSDNGRFKHSFVGLFFLSIFGNKKLLKKQLYNEIKMQIDFWRKKMGDLTPISIDSHQHTHMIPLIFKTIMRVINDEKIQVENIRIPAEPIEPFILTPSLYFDYKPSNIIKHLLLNFLNLFNKRELIKSKIPSTLFLGIIFSGHLTEKKIKKILPLYEKKAQKLNKDIEIAFHPGYLEKGEGDNFGLRAGFEKFYLSKWRKIEYDTLIKFK